MRTVTWYFHAILLLMDISVILSIVNNAGMKLFHMDVSISCGPILLESLPLQELFIKLNTSTIVYQFKLPHRRCLFLASFSTQNMNLSFKSSLIG